MSVWRVWDLRVAVKITLFPIQATSQVTNTQTPTHQSHHQSIPFFVTFRTSSARPNKKSSLRRLSIMSQRNIYIYMNKCTLWRNNLNFYVYANRCFTRLITHLAKYHPQSTLPLPLLFTLHECMLRACLRTLSSILHEDIPSSLSICNPPQPLFARDYTKFYNLCVFLVFYTPKSIVEQRHIYIYMIVYWLGGQNDGLMLNGNAFDIRAEPLWRDTLVTFVCWW